MKTVFCILFPVLCVAQVKESDRLYKAINAKRQKLDLPTLIYVSKHQTEVEVRLDDVIRTNNPSFPENCDCDAETVLSADSMKELIIAATDPQWLHFRDYVRKITVSVRKTENKYYTVIRTFQ